MISIQLLEDINWAYEAAYKDPRTSSDDLYVLQLIKRLANELSNTSR